MTELMQLIMSRELPDPTKETPRIDMPTIPGSTPSPPDPVREPEPSPLRPDPTIPEIRDRPPQP
jgi:hypothetical protein